MRAVLDVNVLIAAAISSRGAPARILAALRSAEFEIVLSPMLLAELRRALADLNLARLIDAESAAAYVDWLVATAEPAPDPAGPPPVRSVDPGDDYLITLAASARCVLVSGDADLTSLAPRIPVMTPSEFVGRLAG